MRELTRHRESLVRKKGDLKREVLAHLLQKGVKVPDEHRTNFTQKHIAWMRSLDDLLLNDNLDVLEVIVVKTKGSGRQRWIGKAALHLIGYRTFPTNNAGYVRQLDLP